MRRLTAADESTLGLNITSLPLLAARLAGGFLRPTETDDLDPAIKEALDAGGFAELEPLCKLPGTTRAVARTLRKIWDADVQLENIANPRIADLALIERRVRDGIHASAKLPRELRDRALGRVSHARAVVGDIELDRLLYVAEVWRPLIQALSKVVRVRWIDPGTADVSWFPGEIVTSPSQDLPAPHLVTCANPRSEVIESLRWARQLLASGRARPEEIAICGASTDEWDDHVLTLAKGSGLPVHMSNGLPALATDDGQACASLADILGSGLSQERVRRLFAHAIGVSRRLKELPRNWSAGISRDAGLFQVEHWRRALEEACGRDSAASNVAAIVVPALAILARGTAGAEEAGADFLRPSARVLWTRALRSGPAEALSLSLQDLRLTDSIEPGASIAWCPANYLIGAPRRWVWLLGMTSGTWPSRNEEDPLLPDHLLSQKVLNPDPLSDRQRRAFQLIRSRASGACFISRSRRSAQGGLLPGSPLLAGLPRATDLRRGRIPKHAFSEADRLLARRRDAEDTPRLRSATTCWSDWSTPMLTAHDGEVGSKHVVVLRALAQTQSATSLRRLLRDPISFVWRYALGWQSTAVLSEPLELDARAYGELVHQLLRITVDRLEPVPGYTRATKQEIGNALEVAVATVRDQWPVERAIPPLLLWLHTLELAERLAFRALTCDDSFNPGTRCWTEVPFGSMDEVPGQWPWTPTATVVIPRTNVSIRGNIDRLDLNAPGTTVRVTDYKTGLEPPRAETIVVSGGSELQRVIYAIAATRLLPDVRRVVPRLFYLREDFPRAHALKDVDKAMAEVGAYVASACTLLEQGKCLPGLRRDEHDEYLLALPAAREMYFKAKDRALRRAFGAFSRIWSAP